MNMVILVFALVLAAVAQADVLYGDANGDGVVTMDDAVLVHAHAIGGDTVAAENRIAADIDKSGFITTYDSSLIQKFLKDEIALPYVKTTSITTSVRATTWADVKRSVAR